MKLIAALSVFSASVDACGGTVNEYQSISSPGHYYDNDLDCTWNIELGDVPSFTIVNNLFDVEYNSYCGFDFLKLIDGNGYERNFCGETYSQYYSSSSSSGSYSSSGSSSSYSSSSSSSYSGRKRRSGEDKKEGGKWTSGLVNVSNDGFPDRMTITGGSATIRFVTDFSVQHQGFDFSIEKPSRFDIIEYHVGRVVDSVADERWGGRYAGRMAKALNRIRDADNGVSCYAENFPEEAGDEGDEVTVFDADNMCKLNGQVNAAINSYARNFACDGRGKVYRQIIRSARKVKKFFSNMNEC